MCCLYRFRGDILQEVLRLKFTTDKRGRRALITSLSPLIISQQAGHGSLACGLIAGIVGWHLAICPAASVLQLDQGRAALGKLLGSSNSEAVAAYARNTGLLCGRFDG